MQSVSVDIQDAKRHLKERIKRLEDLGQIGSVAEEGQKKIPSPIPVQDGIAQKFLQEERNRGNF